ncbi:MAG: TIGR00375 family protein [Methanobacteriota archaeon]|nr:MAG: TIGR00375 family protein [Euryarchaeota archaeon]
MKIDCDLHIHSRFSAATSSAMDLENISAGAAQKGLHVVATGDALNKHWLEEIETLDFKKGLARLNGTTFILTTEVEDEKRVHHLVLFKDLDSVHALRDLVKGRAPDMDVDGRPHLRMDGEEIARACHEAGAMVGPSHAFVPWTSIYKEYDSISECYGEEGIDFLELGLSADTYLASSIGELEGITFLSNSDAHSPQPHRLGREFNRLEVDGMSFEEIKKAILGREGRRVVLNVGLDPRLGKYHRTACIRCYTHYSLEEAVKARWRCPGCGGRIKKGVLERIGELEDGSSSVRPPYLRIAPLAEIIAKVVGSKSVYSAKVNRLWSSLVDAFGSEIKVLIDAPIEEIKGIDEATAGFIQLYREGRFTIKEGGGGRYGEIVFERPSGEKRPHGGLQKSLDLF